MIPTFEQVREYNRTSNFTFTFACTAAKKKIAQLDKYVEELKTVPNSSKKLLTVKKDLETAKEDLRQIEETAKVRDYLKEIFKPKYYINGDEGMYGPYRTPKYLKDILDGRHKPTKKYSIQGSKNGQCDKGS